MLTGRPAHAARCARIMRSSEASSSVRAKSAWSARAAAMPTADRYASSQHSGTVPTSAASMATPSGAISRARASITHAAAGEAPRGVSAPEGAPCSNVHGGPPSRTMREAPREVARTATAIPRRIGSISAKPSK